MLVNLNLPIIIAVVIAGIIGFIGLIMSGSKINRDNNLDKLYEYEREQELNDAAGVGDGSYYGKWNND